MIIITPLPSSHSSLVFAQPFANDFYLASPTTTLSANV